MDPYAVEVALVIVVLLFLPAVIEAWKARESLSERCDRTIKRTFAIIKAGNELAWMLEPMQAVVSGTDPERLDRVLKTWVEVTGQAKVAWRANRHGTLPGVF